MVFNWIPLMAMLKVPLAMVAKSAILAILAMALGVINIVIRSIKLKSMNKLTQGC